MAVLDASLIIYYGRIGKLPWLVGFYGELITTRSVIGEVVDEAKRLRKAGVSAVEDALRSGMLKVDEMRPSERDEARRIADLEGIEVEDAELIVVAKKKVNVLVTNDKRLRLSAVGLGVRAHWATTPVLLAVRRRLIGRTEARAMVDGLIDAGLRIKPETLSTIYRMIEATAS